MRFNLFISGGLYDSDAGHRAWHFCRAAIDAGHEIKQVFFYHAGVTHGTALAEPLADEFDAAERWAELARDHQLPLVVCVSAAERRGVINQEQQAELQKSASNLRAEYSVAGLASFFLASEESDRTVSFK